MQDAWTHWDATGSKVTMRCQCVLSQGIGGVLAWQVSPGWEVKDVTPLEGTNLRSWAQTTGGMLLLEPRTLWQPGQTVTTLVVLRPTAPDALMRQPRTGSFPSQTDCAGQIHRLVLDHLCFLVPSSVTPPSSGTAARRVAAFPAADRPALWTAVANVPAYYWQLSQPEGGELVIVQAWEPTYHAAVRTQVIGESQIRVRITLRPVAGQLTRLTVQSSVPLPALVDGGQARGRRAVGSEVATERCAAVA